MQSKSETKSGYSSLSFFKALLIYISLANSLDHYTQGGGTGSGGDMSPSLGRCSVIDGMAAARSVLMASSELGDSGGKGVVVLKVLYEHGELGCLHAMAAGVLPIPNGSKHI